VGGGLFPIPRPLELQEYHFRKDGNLNEVLGLTSGEALTTDLIIEILLFASVLEEFVVSRMAAHAEAACDVDPRTYFMLMDIVVDELRHSTYTQEQAYLLAGPERLDFAIQTHRRLREELARFAAFQFRLIFDHLLTREVVKLGRLEYAGWRAASRVQERLGVQVISPMARPHPELLVTRPYPYGMAGRPVSSTLTGSLSGGESGA